MRNAIYASRSAIISAKSCVSEEADQHGLIFKEPCKQESIIRRNGHTSKLQAACKGDLALISYRLPDNVTFDEGALLEPLAVAVHAARRARIQPGSSCTIIGAGAIGLLCALAARREGCTKIVIADIVESRVRFACEQRFADAAFVVQPKKATSVEDSMTIARDTAAAIADTRLADGTEIGSTDYTFECTGVESCVQASIFVRST